MSTEKNLESNISQFNSHVKQKKIKPAEEYFLRSVDVSMQSTWKGLFDNHNFYTSKEFKEFIIQCHEWIKNMAKSYYKTFDRANSHYYSLIENVILYLPANLQAEFFYKFATFYEINNDYFTALHGYARSYALQLNADLVDSINQIIFCLQQPYVNLVWLDEALWKSYVEFKFSLSLKEGLNDAFVVQNKIERFSTLVAQLKQKNAKILIDDLYHYSGFTELLNAQDGSLLRRLASAQDEDDPNQLMQQVTKVEKEIEKIILLLAEHHQLQLINEKSCYWEDQFSRRNLNYSNIERIKHDVLEKIANKPTTIFSPSLEKTNPCFQWQIYQGELMQLRKTFAEGLAQKTCVIQLQENYSKSLSQWLQRMLNEIVSQLGTPPTPFCVIVGGSFGRFHLTPCSDIDIAILIKDENYRLHPYWYSFVHIWEIWLTALGEAWGIKNQREIQSYGLSLDSGDLPFLFKKAPELIQTPKNLAQWVIDQCTTDVKNKSTLFELAFGLLTCQAIYHSDNSSFLDKEYKTYLAAIAPTNFATLLFNNINHTVFATLNNYTVPIELFTDQLKKEYLKPLIYYSLIMQIALYGKGDWSNQLTMPTIFNMLQSNTYFNKHWTNLLAENIVAIETLRCQLQLTPGYLPTTTFSRAALTKNLPKYLQLPNIFEYSIKPIILLNSIKTLSTPLNIWQNPPLNYFNWRLQQWWADTSRSCENKNWIELQASIRYLLWHLSYQKAPIYSTEQYSYYHLIAAFHLGPEKNGYVTVAESEAFRQALLSLIKNLSNEQVVFPVEEIEKLLFHYPLPDGTRRNVEAQAQMWERQWRALIVKQATSSSLEITYLEKDRSDNYQPVKGWLHPAIIQLLLGKVLKKNGKHYSLIAKQNQQEATSGRHNVFNIQAIIDGTTINLYCKVFPEMPGLEYGAGMLARRLVGWGMPFVTLVRLKFADGEHPVLLSQAIEGKNLATLDEKDFLSSLTLNPFYYSQRVILSHLLQQEDAKSANLIGEAVEGEERLCSVDNDRSFHPAVVTNPNTQEIVPLVKDITYFFPQMFDPFHPKAREEFLVLDPYAVLHTWLKELQGINEQMQRLFTREDINNYFPEKTIVARFKNFINEQRAGSPTTSILAIPLRQKLANEIYCTFIRLRIDLIQHTELTHIESFRHLQPSLANYYLFYLRNYRFDKYNKPLSAAKRFKLAFKKCYEIEQTEEQILAEKKSKHLEITQSVRLETLQTLQGVPLDANLFHMQNQSPLSALQELEANYIDWAKLDVIKQQLFNAELAGLTAFAQLPVFAKETIINSPDFDWQKIKTAPNDNYAERLLAVIKEAHIAFTLLRLINCRVLNLEILEALLKDSPYLHAIDLSGCDGLPVKTFNILAGLANLKKLRANDWPQLTELILTQKPWAEKIWQGLQYLELQGCTELKKLILNAPTLTHLKLVGAKKFNWSISRLQTPLLKKLFLTDCGYSTDQQQALWNFLQPLQQLIYLELPHDREEKNLAVHFYELEKNTELTRLLSLKLSHQNQRAFNQSKAKKMFSVGDGYFQQKKYSDALNAYDEAIKLNANYGLWFAQRAQTKVALGEAYYEDAIRDYDQAIKLTPDNASYIAARGEVYQKMGKYDKAAADYILAERLQPSGYVYEKQFLASVNAAQSEPASALTMAYFNAILTIKPMASYFFARAKLNLQNQQLTQALADYNEAIQLDSSSAEYFHERGMLKEKANDLAGAFADFLQTYTLKPDVGNFVTKYDGLMRQAMTANEYEKAVVYLDFLLSLQKEKAEYYYLRGKAKEQLTQVDDALLDYDKAIEHQKDKAEYFRARGELYEKQAKIAKALADFKQALQLDASHNPYTEKYEALLQKAIENQQYAEALLYLDFVMNVHSPQASDIGNYVAKYEPLMRQAMTAHEYPKAIRYLDFFLTLNKEKAEYYYLRGKGKEQLTQLDAALLDYDKAIEHQKDKAEYFRTRGEWYEKQARITEALADFKQALQLDASHDPYTKKYEVLLQNVIEEQQYSAALLYVEFLIGVHPDQAEYHYLCGVVKQHLKENDSALTEYNKAIELTPKAHYFDQRGKFKESINDITGAFEDFMQANKLAPSEYNYTEKYHTLAQHAVAQNEYEKALQYDNFLIALCPNTAVYYYERGNVQWALQNTTATLEDYNQAIALDTAQVMYFQKRGELKEKLGLLVEALADFFDAYKLSPDNDCYSEKYYQLALAAIKIKDYPQSLIYLNFLIQIQSNNSDYYYHKAKSHQHLEQYTAALADYTQAILLDNSHAHYFAKRARVYKKIGNTLQAIEDYLYAERLQPDCYSYQEKFYQRGLKKIKENDYIAAERYLDAAINYNIKNIAYIYQRAKMHKKFNNPEKMLVDYDLILQFFPKEIKCLKKRAKLYESLDAYKKAIDDYTQLLELVSTEEKAEYYHLMGKAWYKLKEYKKAIKHHDQAIHLSIHAKVKNFKKDIEYFYHRAQAKVAVKDYDAALQDYTTVINLAMNYSFNSKTILSELSFMAESNFFSNINHLKKTDAVYFAERGEIYFLLKEYSFAVKDFDIAVTLESNSAKYFLCRGKAKYHLKDYHAALEDFNQALTLDPTCFSIYAQRANAFKHLHLYPQAIQDFQQALTYEPLNEEYLYNYALLLYERKKFEAAINQLDIILTTHNNFILALGLRGICYKELENLTSALENFNQAIGLIRKDSSIREIGQYTREKYLENLLFYRGKVHFLLKTYLLAVVDYHGAIRSNPTAAIYYKFRAMAYEKRNDYTEAIKDFMQYYQLSNKLKEEKEIIRERINDYIEESAWIHAIGYCSFGISLYPSEAEYWYLAGTVYEKQHDSTKALDNYNKAIELQPNTATYIYKRAQLKRTLGKLADAIEDYNQLIKLEPKTATYFVQRASLKEMLKQYVDAIQDLSKALELNPDNFYGFFKRATLNAELGKYQQVVADYSQGLSLKHKAGELLKLGIIYNSRGNAYYSLGQYQEALNDYNEALSFEPKNTTYFINRGKAQEKLHNIFSSINDHFSAFQLNPECAVICREDFFNYSITRAAQKDYANAIIYYNVAVGIFEDNNKYLVLKTKAQQQLIHYAEALETVKLKSISSLTQFLALESNKFNLLATEKIYQNKYKEAIFYCELINKLDVKNTECVYLKAHIYQLQGQYSEALKYYTLVKEKEPHNARYLLAHANCYRDDNFLEKAIELYSVALVSTNDHNLKREILHNSALALYRSKNYSKAIDNWRQVFSYCSEQARWTDSIYFYLVFACQYKDNYLQAIEQYSNILKKYPAVIDVLIFYGWACYLAGKFNEALASYDTILSQQPDNYLALEQRYFLYLAIKNFKASANELKKIIAFNQNTCLSKEDIQQAKNTNIWENIEKSKPNKKDESERWYNCAKIKEKLGWYYHALQDYHQAIGLEKNNALYLASCAQVNIQLKEFKKATSDLDKALKLDATNTLYLCSRAALYADQHQYSAAIDDYTKALSYDVKLAVAFNNRGSAKYQLGLYSEAIEDYDKAINLVPTNATYFSNRGKAKQKLGAAQILAALKDFFKAKELAPYTPLINDTALYEFSYECACKNSYVEAIVYYNVAVALCSENNLALGSKEKAKNNLKKYSEALLSEAYPEKLTIEQFFAKEAKRFSKLIELETKNDNSKQLYVSVMICYSDNEKKVFISELISEGLVCYQQHNYTGAIKNWNKIKYYTNFLILPPLIQFYIQFAEEYRSDAMAVVTECTAMLAYYPNAIPLLIYQGWAYYSMGEAEKALDCYNQALKIQPNNYIALYNRYLAYVLQKRNNLATNDLNRINKDAASLVHEDITCDFSRIKREFSLCSSQKTLSFNNFSSFFSAKKESTSSATETPAMSITSTSSAAHVALTAQLSNYGYKLMARSSETTLCFINNQKNKPTYPGALLDKIIQQRGVEINNSVVWQSSSNLEQFEIEFKNATMADKAVSFLLKHGFVLKNEKELSVALTKK